MPTEGRSVLVIGAGLSGLTAARGLSEGGARVTVVDKGRGPGGRASRRRAGRFEFDHGAQYFTVRDARFEAEVAAWSAAGVAAPWEGRIVALDSAGPRDVRPIVRRVGVPGMSAVVRQVGRGLDVRSGVRVTELTRVAAGWRARDEAGEAIGATWDRVLLALPPAQAAELLGARSSALAATLADVRMLPCWAVLLGFDARLGLAFDGAFVDDSRLVWAARNSSKPGRAPGEAWVLHAAPEWSERHWAAPPPDVVEELSAALAEHSGRALPEPVHVDTHRWRYALAANPLDEGCLFDAELGVAACGDWCAGSRIEGAYVSGLAAARALAS